MSPARARLGAQLSDTHQIGLKLQGNDGKSPAPGSGAPGAQERNVKGQASSLVEAVESAALVRSSGVQPVKAHAPGRPPQEPC